MRAIILAAGAGTRLRHLTRQRPKCLLPVGGRPMLEHQLTALQAVGINDIVIVVGFEAAQVRAACPDTVTLVHNEDWATTNSIYSLFLAADWIDGARTMLFNCDILFDQRLLARMLADSAAGGAGSVLAVDDQAERIAGEMNVQVDDTGVVRAIGKHLDPATTNAVSVQLAAFDAPGAALVRAELKRLVQDDVRDAFPTSSYGPLIRSGGLHAVQAGDLPWAEIDTVEEFEQAERDVAPRLLPA